MRKLKKRIKKHTIAVKQLSSSDCIILNKIGKPAVTSLSPNRKRVVYSCTINGEYKCIGIMTV